VRDTGRWSASRKRVGMMSGAKEDNVEAEEAALFELERELEKRRAALVTLRASQSSKKDGFLANITRRQLLDTTALLELLKWNTPTIYNGWEQITSNPMYGRECFNLEPIQDHSPEMGPMIGYAVTVRIRPGVVPGTEPAPSHAGMWDFMGSLPADLPKIIVVEDLTKPVIYGSMWGEVNATYYKAAGAVGCITDGGVRDLLEMKNVGFHAMSRGVTISHAFGVAPVEWDVPISVFGVTVRPGQLIHADQHGFLVIPEEDEPKLEEATSFMDSLERQQVLVPGRRAMATGVHPSITAARMQQVRAIQIKTKHDKYGTYQERFGGKK